MNDFSDPPEQDHEELVAAIADEYCDCLDRGESPDIDQIARQHRELSDIIRRTLGALKEVRSLGAEDLIPAGDDGEPHGQRNLGDFRIIREIGRGGMGVVFEAQQLSLGRRVALKVLPFAAVLDPRQLQRFKNEAQAAALLHHQNIVPVHGVGCARGVHYYAMQFIEGHSVAAVIKDMRRLEGIDDRGDEFADVGRSSANTGTSLASGKLESGGRPSDSDELTAGQTLQRCSTSSPANETTEGLRAVLSTARSSKSAAYYRSIAELGIQVADALDHAHREGVVHRDIKPSNLILDPAGKIWVTDFGLARMESSHGVTMSGDLIGTLRYMSPEQALAKREIIDHRTDIYSLGVTLYELLTLRAAYPGDDRQELIRAIASDEPKPPRHWNRWVPVELETIVLKAIAKEPTERFASAKELAEDLERFLEDKPIRAKRATLPQRLTKWSRRHRSVVATAVVMSVMAVIGLAVSNFLIARQRNVARTNYENAETARQQAVANFHLTQTQRLRAETSEEQARRRLVRLTLANGMQHLESGEWLSSLPWFVEALRLDAGDEAREHPHRLRIGSTLRHCPKLTWMWFREGPTTFVNGTYELKLVNVAEFSPDGRYVVAPSGNQAARVWDTATGQLTHVLAHDWPVMHASFSPDGHLIATACGDLDGGRGGYAAVWDAVTGRQIARFTHDNAVLRSLFGPGSDRLLTGSYDNTARVWDARTGEPLSPSMQHVIDPPHESVLAFSPDGRHVITMPIKGMVTIRDLETAKQLSVGGALHASFSPDGSRAVIGGEVTRVWDVAAGTMVSELPQQSWDASFSPDGQWVVTGSMDQTAQVWEVATGRRIGAPMHHRSGVARVRISPDGRYVVTASWDRTAGVWEAATGQPLTLPLKHGGDVMCAAFSPDGHRIVTASTDLLVRVWDLANIKGISRPLFHSRTVSDRSFRAKLSPDGKLVATAGADGMVKVWNAATQTLVTSPLEHNDTVHHVAFSPDGRRLLTTCADGSARIWGLATGVPIGASLRHGNSAVIRGTFSPDGRRVATGSADHVARVWDLETGSVIVTFQHSGTVIHAWFSPDGCRVLSASAGEAQVWDADSARPITPPLQHKSAITYTAFNPDGDRVLTTSFDGTAQVWDAATGEPIGKPLWHGQAVAHGVFSPDGRRVVTGSNDNTARMWDIDTGKSLTLGWQANNVWHAAFSPDGRLLATAALTAMARVWDADTGVPLTGILRHAPATWVEFSPDGRRLLTGGWDATARLWDLQPDDRPVEDLVLLAQVLCGHRIDESGGRLDPVEPEALHDAWKNLRHKYPTHFVATPEDLFTWHRSEADECERLGRYREAIEHLHTARQYSSDALHNAWYHSTLERLETARAEATQPLEHDSADETNGNNR